MASVPFHLRLAILVSAFFALASVEPPASAEEIKFTVSAGKHDRKNTPICVKISVTPAAKDMPWATVSDGVGQPLIAQLTAPSLLASPTAKPNMAARELHFILPELKAGQTKEFTATLSVTSSGSKPSFRWQDTPGEHDDLSFNGHPVMRYMYHKPDSSTPEARDATLKVYHHVWDPEGKQMLTKGPGGLYTHHRGLFYGFNKVTYGDGKTCDIWHCRQRESQEHVAVRGSEAGPVLGRHLLQINWNGKDGELFAKELREMTVYNTPGGMLIEFASRLTPVLTPVKLDGDPQHAGFHFRATQQVAEKDNIDQTYYIRPDGVSQIKGKAGTKNWPAQREQVNLPWNAMSIVVGGKRYSVAYLDHDKNPKEARYSEREYGRFGSYFVADLTSSEKPLDVNYRVWIQDGEMTPPQVAALDADFDDAPTVTVK